MIEAHLSGISVAMSRIAFFAFFAFFVFFVVQSSTLN